MRLNAFEKALMNNPLRAAFHRHFEARRLKSLAGPMPGGCALEIGCGRGVGVGIIQSQFGADRVHAFDLDPEMVQLAKRLLNGCECPSVLWVGDATGIATRSGIYDAVFDFGAIHHIVAWRKAVAEVFRVLKPGGRFYAEEILDKYIVHPLFRRLLDHPQEDRFNQNQFVAALEDCGFRVTGTAAFMQLFAWFSAEKPAD